MKKKDKILGLLPEHGGSIKRLKETGQHSRLITYYFKQYIKSFDKVYYFSYADEKLTDYTNDSELLEKVIVLPKKIRVPNIIYSFLIPFHYSNQIRQCGVIRVFQLTGIIPAILSKMFFNIPWVSTYGFKYSELARLKGEVVKSAMLSFIEFLGFKFASGIIVTTEAIRSHIIKRYDSKRVHFIPNGVDIELFSPTKKHKDKPKNIIFVGRLEPEKNILSLLDAASIVNKNIPLKITLIGDGSLKQSILQRAVEKGLEIYCAGVIQHECLPKYLNQGDIFVLPSFSEGNPKVLIEAMSCSLPCVVSDCEGNRALVKDGKTGLLFDPYNVEDIAEKIQKVLSDEELSERLSKNAREFIIKNFDINKLISYEVSILGKLVS